MTGEPVRFWRRCPCGAMAWWTESMAKDGKTAIRIDCTNCPDPVIEPDDKNNGNAERGWGWLRDYYNRRVATA